MAIQCIRIYVSAIQISCVLINADLFVSSVCLEDVSSFVRDGQACVFRTVDFDNIFNDSTKRCHIDCSILSSAPPLSHMNRVYRILTIEVLLLSDSNGFNLQSSCLNSNPSLIIKIGCEGEFIHIRGIRERCVSDTQCKRGTTNSICNETSGLCQCKAGSLFLWESHTCSPVKRETDKNEKSHTGLVIPVGGAGLVLGVAICGTLYLIMTRSRNQSQIRCNKQIPNEAFVQISCSLNPETFDIRQGNDDLEAISVYNHVHEPINISVQPDYDHLPQHGMDDDDYSHINSCNANQVDSSGEYGVIS